MAAAGRNQGNPVMKYGEKMEITYKTSILLAVWFTVWSGRNNK
jgi:hypothetical protein